MDRDEIVCNCMGVTAGEIMDAIEAGAKTVEDIQEATGAGTVCGGCIGDIEHLLEEAG
ncbi:MAG: (2Fe-2S)-binding protein [Lachnospiraceae bacterium]|nr:(2Fe-2S)-binding protein [Lachnospiraceae bacterium]